MLSNRDNDSNNMQVIIFIEINKTNNIRVITWMVLSHVIDIDLCGV